MSFPIHLGDKTWWFTPSPEGEIALDKLALEYPNATPEELLTILCERNKAKKNG